MKRDSGVDLEPVSFGSTVSVVIQDGITRQVEIISRSNQTKKQIRDIFGEFSLNLI